MNEQMTKRECLDICARLWDRHNEICGTKSGGLTLERRAAEALEAFIGVQKDRTFVVKLRNNLWLSDDPFDEPPTTMARYSAKRFESEDDANAVISEFLTSEFPKLKIQELEITWEPVARNIRSFAATAYLEEHDA